MKICLFFSILFLCACTKGQGISLAPYQDKEATPYHFSVCHGFGCGRRAPVQLTLQDWRQIRAVFKPDAGGAQEERNQIVRAIALMEGLATKKSGLPQDRGEARTFKNKNGQMDCIDETINTSQYLKFLQGEDLLKFHDVAEPVHRGFFIDGRWPHNSAAIRVKSSDAVFAVDSYYFDSGEKISIVPFDIWHAGWRPANPGMPPKPAHKPVKGSAETQ